MLHVPTCCEAQGDGETALLRLVEALVQRLLSIGQTPKRRGARGQRIRAIAEPLGCIDRLPGDAARRAPREPLLADVPQRLLDRFGMWINTRGSAHVEWNRKNNKFNLAQ